MATIKEDIISELKGFDYALPPHIIQYRMILRGANINLTNLTTTLEEMADNKEIIKEDNPRDNGDWKYLYRLE